MAKWDLLDNDKYLKKLIMNKNFNYFSILTIAFSHYTVASIDITNDDLKKDLVLNLCQVDN